MQCSLRLIVRSELDVPTFTTRREHPVAEGGTVGEKCPGILSKWRLSRYIYGSFTCRKATTWGRRLYFPSEGRHAVDFFPLKIRRLQPAVNSRTWVPKASMLPLDHRSRLMWLFPDIINCVTLHIVGYILEYSYDAWTHKR